MTTTHTLKAEKREGRGKGAARKLRQAGRVPGILYGKDMDNVPISLDAMEVEHLFQSISTENTLVQLDVKGVRGTHEILVREIQTHPFKNELIHVDFLRVQAGVEVDVEVPVDLVGVPFGVRMHGGVLEQIIHEVPVRCIPSKIPQSFEVDVSELDVETALHVSDLTLGEGVELTIDPEQTLCLVAAPRGPTLEELEAEAAAAALAEEVGEAPEPEVIGESEGDAEDEG
jgi:large subunit ribosomal protein L25